MALSGGVDITICPSYLSFAIASTSGTEETWAEWPRKEDAHKFLQAA
jgi:hypothetical protein